MATICSSCLHTISTATGGRCPNRCTTRQTDTRANGWDRYPAEYRANRDILLADHPTCHWGCGRPATTADHHPIPRSKGGGHGLDNLVPACGSCNSARGARLVNQARTHAL